MKPFEEVSYGSIEQTSGYGGPPSPDSSKKCSQKESASNLIAGEECGLAVWGDVLSVWYTCDNDIHDFNLLLCF